MNQNVIKWRSLFYPPTSPNRLCSDGEFDENDVLLTTMDLQDVFKLGALNSISGAVGCSHELSLERLARLLRLK